MSHPDDKPDCPFCPAPLYKHACPTDSRPSNAPSEVEVEWTTNDDLNADPPGAPDSRPSASRNETKAIEDLYEKAQTLIDEAFYIGLNYAESPQRKALDRIARTLDDEQRPSDACSKCGAVDPGDVYVYGMSFLSTENGKRICRDRDACARHSNDARIGYPCACTWVGKNEEARATLKPCEMHRIWAEGLRLDKVPGTGTLLLASGICLTAGEVDEVLAARRTDYPTVGSKVRNKGDGQVAVVTAVEHRLSVELEDKERAAASAWYGRVWSARDVDVVTEACSANPEGR